MAYMFLKKEIVCFLCAAIYTDPVMLHCGHNFCCDCIKSHISQEGLSGVYHCPECKQTSKTKAPLTINTKLQTIAQHWKTVENRYRLGDTSCTYCLANPGPAVKFCLHCESSLCEKHLEIHSKTQEHSLADVMTPVHNRLCRVHGEIIKFFCLEDKSVICMLCFLAGTHQRHRVELLEVAAHRKKRELQEVAELMRNELDVLKRTSNNLHEVLKENKEKGDLVKGEIRSLCGSLLTHVRQVASKMEANINQKEVEAFRDIVDEIASLDDRGEQLSQKIKHFEGICNQEDPVIVLQDKTCHDRCGKRPKTRHGASAPRPKLDLLFVSLKLKESVKNFAKFVPDMLSSQCLHLKYKADIVLNSDTASDYLRVTSDRKAVSYTAVRSEQKGDRPGRFRTSHVLSESLFSSGKHYWEVNGSRNGIKSVGVAYPSIKKEGAGAYIGYNKKSWCLTWSHGYVAACHNSSCRQIACGGSTVASVAVYVDYDAGKISFYKICSPIKHLYTFNAKFSEPLHAAFYIVDGWLKISP